MFSLPAVALAATCFLPPDARIILEAEDPACSTYEICAPGMPIRFSVTSAGACDWFQWTFPDGTTSTEREPVHAFTSRDYQVVTLITGLSQRIIGVDTRPNRYDMYALGASPVEISARSGETITFTVRKKFTPNPGVFSITCGGAIQCAPATIGMNETSTTFVATATGAGGLF